MRILKYFALSLLFAIQFVSAQKLQVSLDWATFAYDQDNAYLEFYYAFPQNRLNYQPAADHLLASTLGAIRLYNQQQLVKEFVWKSEITVASQEELKEQKSLVDKIGLAAPYGVYEGEFVLTDLFNPANKDSLRFTLKAPLPAMNQVYMSEIELARSISPGASEDKSPFYKNGLIVEPHPNLVYSFEQPALFYYLEVYHLPAAGLPGSYRLHAVVRDEFGQPIADGPEKMILKKNVVHPSVEFGMLNVGKLKSQTYQLVVEILNDADQVMAQQTKKFYVIQEDFTKQMATLVAVPFNDSIFAVMDSAQVELEFAAVFYMLSKEEQIVHKQVPHLDAKRQFIYSIWSRKFPQYPLNENPARIEYFQRLDYANQQYRAFKLDGWRTDRGRVYMLYGPPDDIDRYPNEPNFYPYEVWYYNKLQNGVRFVFGDLEGHSNYRLVHSELIGEIQDANYMQVLRRGF
ncbi:MAG: GWxTD domain-containing protein [Calditrichaeota bacterium]|nr:MAG: GWxTD domain-containing protein [Calditrichota bacterium]